MTRVGNGVQKCARASAQIREDEAAWVENGALGCIRGAAWVKEGIQGDSRIRSAI